MATLLLSSNGIQSEQIKDEILKILPKAPSKTKIVHIITASKGEKDTKYVAEERKIMEEIGFRVQDIDIEGKNEHELRGILRGFDVVYVQGGNTFYLMKYVKESGFERIIKELVAKGIVYIGVSAGSIIAGPSIEVAGWGDIDRNEVGLKDLSGLNFVPFQIFPHCKPEFEALLREQIKRSRYPLRILTDDQGFLVREGNVILVGNGKEVKI